MEEINEVELQSESIERLLNIVEMLNNILKDSELIKAFSKLVVYEETFLLIDRLPQIIKLLEKISRPEIIDKLNLILDKLSKAIEESEKEGKKVYSLSQLLEMLSQPEVSKGLSLFLSVVKALGSLE
ncbi:MAG: DUF1641 domain-containing protein [Caldisphaeraceae archaeon]|nr:DUF1641 domain-containing protein [Caldisphaeraceae archaeon]MEB3691321.1 DUF1641 domain-containing protein [Caldisphaeraceae archaeon]MEB3797220.1 DUF1641 domain-containing protein [Caldisphaeraceae archaeon]